MPVKKTKQPKEVLDYDIVCKRRLSSDDYIVSVTASYSGPDSSLVIERTAIIEEGTRAKVWISSGTDLNTYKITVLMLTNEGRTIEEEFLLTLKDK